MSILGLSGDAATWFGSVGTWFVGIAAAVIAGRQLYQGGFHPKVSAYQDGLGRIVIRIVNSGSGAGTIQHVLVAPEWPFPEKTPGLNLQVEVEGQPSGKPLPVQLPLAGMATAQIVLIPVRPEEITDRVRVLVYYARRRSRPIELTKLEGAIAGSTSVPGVSIGESP